MCSVPRSLGGPAGNCRLYLEADALKMRISALWKFETPVHLQSFALSARLICIIMRHTRNRPFETTS